MTLRLHDSDYRRALLAEAESCIDEHNVGDGVNRYSVAELRIGGLCRDTAASGLVWSQCFAEAVSSSWARRSEFALRQLSGDVILHFEL